MRNVFVFPAGERARTVSWLDRHAPAQREPWHVAGCLWVEIDDERSGLLFHDWEPEDVAVLEAAVGHRPTWAARIDVSGRVNGRPEVRQLVGLLLAHGGVAVDDHSAHPWTAPEIASDTPVGGLRFFNSPG
ncbi:hypothetical protein RM844_06800 [Streptomyces sp. DSM 44915]|uniref:Uncharacterized protein n=1 Tax=Streptomyces chisholmiae TaxID=3075540 RepID=A0ABU2JM06_9ACTN|nr:hypothetical protein [Streptomyces sp. DSM 44915]MDT0266000.1 hypothetical protein [Streptomyces sp. DSM 44915]